MVYCYTDSIESGQTCATTLLRTSVQGATLKVLHEQKRDANSKLIYSRQNLRVSGAFKAKQDNMQKDLQLNLSETYCKANFHSWSGPF